MQVEFLALNALKFTRWVGEGMINGGEKMRGSNALLLGFGQGLTKYS